MFIHLDLFIYHVKQKFLVSLLLKHRLPIHDNKVDLPIQPNAEWYTLLLENIFANIGFPLIKPFITYNIIALNIELGTDKCIAHVCVSQAVTSVIYSYVYKPDFCRLLILNTLDITNNLFFEFHQVLSAIQLTPFIFEIQSINQNTNVQWKSTSLWG